MSNTNNDAAPALISLERALLLYPDLPLRTLRAWIASGRLAAVKAGRAYLVRPSDLAALLVPTARPATARARLSVAEAQRAAGLVPAAEALALATPPVRRA